MRTTNLPGTEITVSKIAMGCWALAGDATWGEQSERDSVDAIRAALDQGINFFDTAPGYGGGLSEQRLGRGLSGRRGEAVVATKVGPESMHPTALVASVEQSLSDLGMDHVDLLQIHWPSREVPLSDTWGALEHLVEQGKARALGISNFGPLDMKDMLTVGQPATNQLPYSMLSRAVEYEIAPLSLNANVGMLCYSPLLWGLLADKYSSAADVPDGRARSRHFSPKRAQTRHDEPGCEVATFEALAGIRGVARRLDVPMAELAVAWLLKQPVVTSVLTGIRKPSQALANARAAELVLDDETTAELSRLTEPVKQALGANPDLWQGGDNSRYR